VDLATGAHLDEVVLSTDSVTVTLRLVVITGYKSDLGEGDKAPVDTLTLRYGALVYTAQVIQRAITFSPPVYGCNAAGTSMPPSARW